MSSLAERWRGKLLPVAAVAIACALLGLLAGVAVAMRMAQLRVNHYAMHLLSYAESYADEIESTLDAVNSSLYPFCSDEDIARLRAIVFHGHLVKEIGRVRGDYLYCSSTSGRLSTLVKRRAPDIVTARGRTVRLNVPLNSVPGMKGDITASGEADFVAAPDAFGRLREAPMVYTTLLANHVTGKVLATAGDPLKLTDKEVLGEKTVLRDSTLYVARCSVRWAPCMVAGISLKSAWEMNTPLIEGFAALGALTGVGLGAAMFLFRRRRNLATQLLRALRLNLITLVYQPIVDLKTGEVVGAEALARWINEDGQFVRPDVFVAAAEELGFVGKLTRAVLNLIVEELGEYLRAHPGFQVNINIAAADLADAQFLPMLERLLEKHKIPSSSVGLELTERSTADHELAITAIRKLRERGHAFYIDDFGTGYSSLNYLNQLAVDAIKIDRAFVDAIGTESLTAAIVPQILAMAQSLGIKVVVEGVERMEQSAYFARLDQKILAQGWHFGEPVTAEDLLVLLASKEQVGA
jgi:sensor c-di-GMP phosphodiesterase-like protein